MTTLLFAIAGFITASAIAWGGLFAWGTIFLDAHDSYWDRTPYASDIFLACWLLLAIVGALAGAYLSRRCHQGP